MLTRARIPWNTNQLPTDGCAFQRINDLHRHVPVCGAPLVRGWARDRNWGLHGKFKELLLFSPHLLPPSPATSTVQAAASHQPPLSRLGGCHQVWWLVSPGHSERHPSGQKQWVLCTSCTLSASKLPGSKAPAHPGSFALTGSAGHSGRKMLTQIPE